MRMASPPAAGRAGDLDGGDVGLDGGEQFRVAEAAGDRRFLAVKRPPCAPTQLLYL